MRKYSKKKKEGKRGMLGFNVMREKEMLLIRTFVLYSFYTPEAVSSDPASVKETKVLFNASPRSFWRALNSEEEIYSEKDSKDDMLKQTFRSSLAWLSRNTMNSWMPSFCPLGLPQSKCKKNNALHHVKHKNKQFQYLPTKKDYEYTALSFTMIVPSSTRTLKIVKTNL